MRGASSNERREPLIVPDLAERLGRRQPAPGVVDPDRPRRSIAPIATEDEVEGDPLGVKAHRRNRRQLLASHVGDEMARLGATEAVKPCRHWRITLGYIGIHSRSLDLSDARPDRRPAPGRDLHATVPSRVSDDAGQEAELSAERRELATRGLDRRPVVAAKIEDGLELGGEAVGQPHPFNVAAGLTLGRRLDATWLS